MVHYNTVEEVDRMKRADRILATEAGLAKAS